MKVLYWGVLVLVKKWIWFNKDIFTCTCKICLSGITWVYEHIFNGPSFDCQIQGWLTPARILRWPTVSLAVITHSVEHQCFVSIRPFNYKRLIKKRWKKKKFLSPPPPSPPLWFLELSKYTDSLRHHFLNHWLLLLLDAGGVYYYNLYLFTSLSSDGLKEIPACFKSECQFYFQQKDKNIICTILPF